MRHLTPKTVLDRKKAARTALIRGLAQSLLLHNRIKTTPAKARAAKQFAERLITHGKENTLANRRYIIRHTGSADLAEHILTTVAPKYKDRAGGYTRMLKIDARKGDGADQVILELV